ncbi:MAG: FAD:protein FMN transferase [Acidobacteria bacterium]|nr:FAD:protein FMN transferase [Acidobacteriota bacterium]
MLTAISRRALGHCLRTWSRLYRILFLVAMGACSRESTEPVTRSFASMGTQASVTVAAEYRDRLPELTEAVHEVLRRLEDQLSTYRSDSEISRLAAAAGRFPISVSADTRRILELARRYGELSRGAFDVTVAPLVQLWGFGRRARHSVPDPEVIEDRLRLVNFRSIELQGGSAFLPAGMSLDLGGIGKGFAVDKAVEVLRRSGVRAAMVDLGGNIRVLGQAEPGTSWTIGIRNPFESERVLGVIKLPDGMAVATSGNYERFVEIGGRRYSHIIDPRTGYPVEGMAGVTVVSPDATGSDALSTALFVLGVESGFEVLKDVPGTEALFIRDRDPVELWLTPGMATLFTAVPEYEPAIRVLSAEARK